MSDIEQENIDKFLNFLKEKWTQSKKCPICSTNDWRHGQYTLNVEPRNQSKIESAYAVFHIACGNCGYMNFFNAVTIGIVESSDKK